MKVTRKLIHIDEELCNGCGECVPGCEEGALQIIDGKAKLVADLYCDGLGACLGECPTGALTVREVETVDFDPNAVRELLEGQGRAVPEHMPSPESLRLGGEPKEVLEPIGCGCGCSGTKVVDFNPSKQAKKPADVEGKSVESSLTHWPVQLRLVPAEAPFLKGADLLLTADCVAVSMPGYHERFLPGRKVLMGCPKFDDVELYIERLTAIFATAGLKSITLLEMEVPCCSSMSKIVAKALKNSGATIPTEKIIVARSGEVIYKGGLAQPVSL
ncbi:ATP-binding protein [Maridesulfovibrio frigidus]|uniref:ATP-binding protein n=1 Tax=Maridesulfovibrio frigidus TaxID=340956 RepID=UPI0005532D47|nr:4Fe-4S binding protein [Maridesulfovibrio frigidus]